MVASSITPAMAGVDAAEEDEFEFVDAVVVAELVFELGAVAIAQLGRLDEGDGGRRIVDDGEGEARARAPVVHRDAHRLFHDNAGFVSVLDTGSGAA
jgi:hypothetical protein